MYQDIENGRLRNCTPEEICAMYHFHDEYARLGIGAIAFYSNLTEGNKNFIKRMVKDIIKQSAQPRMHLTSGGRGKNNGRVAVATRK